MQMLKWQSKLLNQVHLNLLRKPFNQERLMNFINRAVENINLKNMNKDFER